MAVMNLLVLIAAAAMAVMPSALGHGLLQKPTARQLCNDNTRLYRRYFAIGTENEPFLGGVPGFCGDPYPKNDPANPTSNYYGMPCEPQEVYQEGGILEMEIHMAANHGGFFMVNICESTDMSDECFNKHQLLTVEYNYDRWYILEGEVHPENEADNLLTMQWKLPEGLTCEHCVLMWTWWGAQRCGYRDCRKDACGVYADGLNPTMQAGRVFPECASLTPAKGENPQMFRNCADIKIEGSGGVPAAGSVPAPAPEVMVEETEESEEIEETEETLSLSVKPPTEAPQAVVDEEEKEIMENVSAAGNEMSCADEIVQKVLGKINCRRGRRGFNPLKCSDRSTGVAVNWSEMMCQECALLTSFSMSECRWGTKSDDVVDNCNLSNFAAGCTELVAVGSQEGPFEGLEWEVKKALYTNADVTEVGLGYVACGDNWYWTVLAGAAV